jgi:hypothetical protein
MYDFKLYLNKVILEIFFALQMCLKFGNILVKLLIF